MYTILLYLCITANGWKCGTESSPDLKSARTIPQSRHLSESSWAPIRITYTYDESFSMGSESQTESFKSNLMESVDNFLRSVVKVRPVQGNLILKDLEKCGEVPSFHKTVGLPDTDLSIYIASDGTAEDQWAARAKDCLLDGGPLSNVIAGRMIVNPSYFAQVDFNEALATVVHEIVHILGFSASLYPHYNKDAYGTKYTEEEYLLRENIRGKDRVLLKFPPLLREASKMFACDDVKGIELEEYGGNGTAGAHWDMRIAYNDFMVGFTAPNPIFSTLTFSLLESTGWYQIDYEYLQPIIFGAQQGCDFLYEKCVDRGVSLGYEFCNNYGPTCDMFHVAKGTCRFKWYFSPLAPEFQYFSNSFIGGSKLLMDYCPIREPKEDCRNSKKTPDEDTGEAYGAYSRCVLSTLSPKGSSKETYPGCYELLSCDDGIATFLISYQDKKTKLSCPAEGGASKANSLMDGYLECPESKVLCGSTPCMNNCYGFGKCKDGGICECDNGRGGPDCSIKCHESCFNCFGSKQNQCLSCADPFDVLTNGLCSASCRRECATCSSYDFCTKCADPLKVPDSNGKCECKEKHFEKANRCHSCASLKCDECLSENLCTKCLEGFVLFNGQCLGECPAGHYADSGYCYTCTSIDNCSEQCDSKTGYCLECRASFYPSQGKCVACSSRSGCSDCDPITGSCKECDSPYFLDEGKCYNCSDLEGCKECEIESGCSECKDKYELRGKICIPNCGSLCEDCDIETNRCLSCSETANLVDGDCFCDFGFEATSFEEGEEKEEEEEEGEGEEEEEEEEEGERRGKSREKGKGKGKETLKKKKVDRCSRCVNYFQSSDLSAKFVNQYSAIQISFNKNTLNPPKTCFELLHGDISVLGKDPVCVWADPKTLKIVLGKDFSVENEMISLNGLKITKSELGCDSKATEILAVEIFSVEKMPVPKARISGPQNYSLACSDSELVLSGAESSGSSKHSLKYEWVSTFNNDFFDLEGKGIPINESKLIIPNAELEEGDYEFVLIVTNVFLNSDSASQTVVVTNSDQVNVKFDGPSEVEIFFFENVVFTALVISDCAYAEPAQFVWSLLSNLYISPSVLDRANRGETNNQLQIKSGELFMGFTYYFKVSVTVGDNLSGSAILTVSVTSRNIVSIIPQLGGDISSRVNLKLDGTLSYDLNDHSPVDGYYWECFDTRYNPCIDSRGRPLLKNPYSKKIEVPKESIEADSYYLFILTVYKDLRSDWDYVELWTRDVEPSSITLKYTDFKVSVTKDLYLKNQLDVQFKKDIAWYQVFGDPIQPASDKISEHLYIKAFTMEPGKYYSWEAKHQQNFNYIDQFNWHTNLGPTCERVQHTSYEKNYKVKQVFTLEECYDRDGEDEPLLYSFAVFRDEEYLTIKEDQMSNELDVLIPPGNWTIKATVHDQLGDSEEYLTSIQVKETRILTDHIDPVHLFREEAKNSESIAMAVFYFAHEADISAQLWEVMFEHLQSYTASALKDHRGSTNSIILAVTELAKDSSVDKGKFEQCIDFVEKLGKDKDARFDESTVRLLIHALDEVFPRFYKDLAITESVHRALRAVLANLSKYSQASSTEFESDSFLLRREHIGFNETVNKEISINKYILTLPPYLSVEKDVNAFVVMNLRQDRSAIDVSLTLGETEQTDEASHGYQIDSNSIKRNLQVPIRMKGAFDTETDSRIDCYLLLEEGECKVKEEDSRLWEVEAYEGSVFSLESRLKSDKEYTRLGIGSAIAGLSGMVVCCVYLLSRIERKKDMCGSWRLFEELEGNEAVLDIAEGLRSVR